MEIKPLKKDSPEFIELNNQVGSVFSSEAWLSMFDENLELLGIYNGPELDGFFCLYRTKLKSIKTLACPPFTPHINLYLNLQASNRSKLNKKIKDITRVIADFLDERPEKIILLSLPPHLIDTQAFQWKSFKVIPRYTYQINLNQTLESIRSSMDSKTKSLLNKGKELIVSENVSRDEIKSVIKNSLSEVDGLQNEEVFDSIFAKFCDESNSFITGIIENDIITAGALFIYDKKCMYYLLGGGDRKEKHPAAGTTLIWHGISKAKELGLEVFDFEGSMIPEVERFFRSFGGEITPYYSVNKAPTLLEIPLKKKFKHIF